MESFSVAVFVVFWIGFVVSDGWGFVVLLGFGVVVWLEPQRLWAALQMEVMMVE